MAEVGDPLTLIESLRAELAREREARAALETRLQQAEARTGAVPEHAGLGLAQLQADATADAAGPDAHIELTTWLAQASLAADAAEDYAREQTGLDQAALLQRLSAAPPPAPRAPEPAPAPPADTAAIQAAEARARHHQNQVRRLTEELAAARAEQMRTAARLQALESHLPDAGVPAPEAPAPPTEEPSAGDTPAPFSLDTDWASALPELPTHETQSHDAPAAPTRNDTLLDAVLNFGGSDPAAREPRNPQRPEALEDHSADAAGDALADSAQAAMEAMDAAALQPGDAEAAGLADVADDTPSLEETGPLEEESGDDGARDAAPAGDSPFEEPGPPTPAGGAPTLEEVVSMYSEPSSEVADEEDAPGSDDPLDQWARSTQAAPYTLETPATETHEAEPAEQDTNAPQPAEPDVADADITYDASSSESEQADGPPPETPRWEQALPALQDDWPSEDSTAPEEEADDAPAPREQTIEQILNAWSRDPEPDASPNRAAAHDQAEPPREAPPQPRASEPSAPERGRGKQGKDAMVDALLRFMGPKE